MRHASEIHFLLIDILRKIPLFRNLTVEQFKSILAVSRIVTLRNNQLLCAADDESHELYILLSGSLSVVSKHGETLSTIEPVGVVGEMGLFTGEPRSATVEVSGEALILTLGRKDLDALFKRDSALAITIMANVIRELAGKLARNNIVIEELRHIVRPDTLTITLDNLDPSIFDSDDDIE